MRSINMVRKMNLPVLGVVENFAGEIFGQGAGEDLARRMDLDFLGRLELRPDYRDTSKPAVLLSPSVKAEYEGIVDKVQAALAAVPQTS